MDVAGLVSVNITFLSPLTPQDYMRQSLISEIMSKTEDRPIVINGSIVHVLTVQKEPSIGKIASDDEANTKLINKQGHTNSGPVRITPVCLLVGFLGIAPV